MAGFEPWISGVGSERSANCATTMSLGQCDQMARLFVHFLVIYNNKICQKAEKIAKVTIKKLPNAK